MTPSPTPSTRPGSASRSWWSSRCLSRSGRSLLGTLMRRRRAGFEWAVVWLAPIAIAVGLTYLGLLSGGIAAGAIAIPTAIFGGHLGRGLVTHVDDRRAGHDRGHDSRERTGPQHLVLRRINLRRIRSMGNFDDLAIGVTRRGRVAAIKRGGKSGSHCLIVGATGAGKSTVLGAARLRVRLVGSRRRPRGGKARPAARGAGPPSGSSPGTSVRDGEPRWADRLGCARERRGRRDGRQAARLRGVVGGLLQGRGHPLSPLGSQGDRSLPDPADPGPGPRALRSRSARRPCSKARRSGTERGDQSARRCVDATGAPRRRRAAQPAGGAGRVGVRAQLARPRLRGRSGARPGEAIRRRAVVYFRLDAERLGVVAEKVGAAIAIELGAIASGLQGTPIPTFVGIDESGAIESDHSTGSSLGREVRASRSPSRLTRLPTCGPPARSSRRGWAGRSTASFRSGSDPMTPTRSLASPGK